MLRQQYSWQSFCDVHYRPWEHYVPLRPDLTDLIEKFEWCENHTDACEEIIENTRRVSAMLADRALQETCDRLVIERLEEAIRQGTRGD